eukprot:CAMPEP_0177586930 /NCGR_PEP_ID=MMETSP0419_2-20121207/5355_1 /TAXON_ID=582737 /ORGANISM="Tetraselmis sp., Strain GSL018" /LENGTH=944 /DNA_ID=CAMNT_0019076895 /DNA_START=286 /DNA_END=3117 /DNA_ORIENTATION=+
MARGKGKHGGEDLSSYLRRMERVLEEVEGEVQAQRHGSQGRRGSGVGAAAPHVEPPCLLSKPQQLAEASGHELILGTPPQEVLTPTGAPGAAALRYSAKSPDPASPGAETPKPGSDPSETPEKISKQVHRAMRSAESVGRWRPPGSPREALAVEVAAQARRIASDVSPDKRAVLAAAAGAQRSAAVEDKVHQIQEKLEFISSGAEEGAISQRTADALTATVRSLGRAIEGLQTPHRDGDAVEPALLGAEAAGRLSVQFRASASAIQMAASSGSSSSPVQFASPCESASAVPPQRERPCQQRLPSPPAGHEMGASINLASEGSDGSGVRAAEPADGAVDGASTRPWTWPPDLLQSAEDGEVVFEGSMEDNTAFDVAAGEEQCLCVGVKGATREAVAGAAGDDRAGGPDRAPSAGGASPCGSGAGAPVGDPSPPTRDGATTGHDDGSSEGDETRAAAGCGVGCGEDAAAGQRDRAGGNLGPREAPPSADGASLGTAGAVLTPSPPPPHGERIADASGSAASRTPSSAGICNFECTMDDVSPSAMARVARGPALADPQIGPQGGGGDLEHASGSSCLQQLSCHSQADSDQSPFSAPGHAVVSVVAQESCASGLGGKNAASESLEQPAAKQEHSAGPNPYSWSPAEAIGHSPVHVPGGWRTEQTLNTRLSQGEASQEAITAASAKLSEKNEISQSSNVSAEIIEVEDSAFTPAVSFSHDCIPRTWTDENASQGGELVCQTARGGRERWKLSRSQKALQNLKGRLYASQKSRLSHAAGRGSPAAVSSGRPILGVLSEGADGGGADAQRSRLRRPPSPRKARAAESAPRHHARGAEMLADRLGLAAHPAEVVWACAVLAARLEGLRVRRRLRHRCVQPLRSEISDLEALVAELERGASSARSLLEQRMEREILQQTQAQLRGRRQQLAEVLSGGPLPAAMATTAPTRRAG